MFSRRKPTSITDGERTQGPLAEPWYSGSCIGTSPGHPEFLETWNICKAPLEAWEPDSLASEWVHVTQGTIWDPTLSTEFYAKTKVLSLSKG